MTLDLRTPITIGISVALAACVVVIGRFQSSLHLLLLIALCGLAAVVISGELRRVLLAVAILDAPLEWDFYLRYNESLGGMGAIGGFGIGLTTICLAGLYALWFVNWLHGAEQYRNGWRAAWPLLLYVGAVALSAFVAAQPVLALYELWLLAQTLLLFVYVVAHTRTEREIQFLVGVLLLGVIVESVLAGIGFAAGGDGLRFAGLKMDIDNGRVSGTLGSPNTLSSYIVPPMLLALGVLLTRHSRLQPLALVAVGGGSVILALTQSRGGWLAFGVSLLILASVALHRRWVPVKLMVVGVLGTVGVAVAVGGVIVERLTSFDNGSARSRLPLMELSWRMVADRPIRGHGANEYALHMGDYLPGSLAHEWLYTVHNKYLLVWVENGLIGLLAFLTVLAVFLWRSWRVAQSRTLLAPLGLALFAALVGQAVHMNLDVFHSRPQVQSLWLLFALATALHTEVTA